MRDYQFTIPANSEGGLTARGSFVRVKSVTGDVRLRAVNAGGETVADLIMSAGVRFQIPAQFVGLRIENSSGVSVSGVLTAGDGSADDSSVTGSLQVDKSTAMDDQFDESILSAATYTLAANSSRREVLITNLSVNSAAVRVGPNAAANRGAEVLPGSTITLTTSAAVKIYNTGGAAQSVAIVEVLD